MKSIGKKFGILLLCLTLLLGTTAIFAGCDVQKNPTTADNNGITVICTNFAAFDFTRSMLAYYTENGGNGVVELMILGKPGQDLHSYEPTAQDIISLANADVVVCTGAEGWLDAALKSSGNTVAQVISMMEVSDTVDGEHEHDHDHGGEDCSLIGQDEHVWLSFFNANRICFAISEALRRVDAENKDIWHNAFMQYANELGALEGEYMNMMNSAVRNKVVVADRNPFVYFFRDLDLTCLAAFPGCSSETSASFETQAKLIKYTEEWELPYIFIMEGSDGKVAEVVAGETGAQILTLNSLQVVTDYDNTTYLKVMRENLENLKKALQ
ncbi:MAG: zinc ABC transporter substrate-binding protein [Clostridia bacterium]|nr:zinc ABC transporter substrate-binding protein [Clostridia bacterium]